MSVKEAVDMFSLFYYIIVASLLIISFLLYLSGSVLIYGKLSCYTDQYYQERKISYMCKNIFIILYTILFLATFILDLLFVYFVWKASNYSFYTILIFNHVKVSHKISATFIDGIYLYKLILVMLAVQSVFAILPPIILQIMKFVRRKNNIAVNS